MANKKDCSVVGLREKFRISSHHISLDSWMAKRTVYLGKYLKKKCFSSTDILQQNLAKKKTHKLT